VDALVTDVHIRCAVHGLRALGRAGRTVVAMGPGRLAPGRWSSHAAARAIAPDVVHDPAGYVAGVARVAREQGPLVVYPGLEESIDALLDGPLPAEARLPWPGTAPVRAVRDKASLPGLAAAAGLRTPEVYARASAGELLADKPPIPCVLKPVGKGRALHAPQVIESSERFEDILAALPADEPLLVQERIAGELMAVAVVTDRDGAVVARFQQRARRTWPREAGPSTVSVGVEADPDLVGAAARLLAEAGYWGLAELQLLDDGRAPAVIDVNPRFYGSLPLAVASGVNLPAVWHAVATGEAVAPHAPYRTGVTYRWLEGDLYNALHGMPRAGFERVPAPRVGAMWAGDDPVASTLLAGRALGIWLRRRLPGGRG